MSDIKAKVVDTRLSYSSSTLLKNCSQKYYYYKILGVPKDADSTQSDTAFNCGKAFHYVLEENGHTEDRLDELLDIAVKSFEVEEHRGMLHAMILRYLQVHLKSGLEVVYCELGLNNPIFIGFIDAIMKDAEGGWWIVDLKTAARISEIKLASLASDTQLNLYSSFAKEVAIQLELDPKKFRGARYRVTTKTKLIKKASESYGDYVLRNAKNVKSYDIIIPVEKMDPKGTYAEHKRLHAKTLKMRKGTVKPEKNLSWCDSYFRSCEYWSQCHGSTFTESKETINMLTSNNV